MLLLGGLPRGRRLPGRGSPILHVVHSLDTGGAQRQLIDLARRRRDWGYLSLSDEAGPYEAELAREGLQVTRLYQSFRRSLPLHVLAFLLPSTTALLALARLLRRTGPRCAWGWTFLANAVVAPAARRAGVPRVVIRIENLSAWKSWPPHRRWWNRLADRNAARLADVIVVNAPVVAEDYVRWAGAEPRKIVVMPNAVDGEGWLARPWRDRRRELGIEAGELAVLTVGRLAREKDQALLLRASAAAHRRGLPHRLIVVGDGPCREDLLRQAAALGIGERTHWVGSTEAPQDFYRSADIFALSSEIEGLPNVLLEAQAFGLAVVTTAAGGAGEVVADGETGLVVPVGGEEAFATALGRLLADAELRRRLGEAGQRRVLEVFTVERMVRQVEALSAVEAWP